MKLNILTVFLSLWYLSKGSNNCTKLRNPVGRHPTKGEDIEVGYISLETGEDIVIATPVCDDTLGYTLTNPNHQQFICRKSEISGLWQWGPDTPLKPVRCGRTYPYPLTLTITLTNAPPTCDPTSISRDSEVAAVLPCLRNDTCRVRDVSCDYDEVTVVLESTLLRHMRHQHAMLSEIKHHLAKRNTPVLPDGEKEEEAKCDGIKDDNGCTTCTPGTFVDTTNNECTPCPKGEYSSEDNSDSCTACPEGQTTEASSSNSLDDCALYCNSPVIAQSDQSVATYVKHDSTIDVQCTKGTYGNDQGFTITVKCDTSMVYPQSCREMDFAPESAANFKGGSVTLTCSIETADTVTGLTLYRGAVAVDMSDSEKYTEASLADTDVDGTIKRYSKEFTIMELASSDEAMDYNCVAGFETAGLKEEKSNSVSVEHLDVTVTGPMWLNDDADLVMDCEVEGVPSAYMVTYNFYKDSDELTQGIEVITNGKKLTIQNLDTSNSGTYKCTATLSKDGTEMGSLQKTTQFNIRGFKVQPDASNIIKKGLALNLTCIAYSDQQVEIKWTKGDEDITGPPTTSDGNDRTSKLELSGLTEANSGVYKCTFVQGDKTYTSDKSVVTVFDIGITVHPLSASFEPESDGTLACNFKTGFSPLVEWYMVKSGGDVEQDSDNIHNNADQSVLSIPEVSSGTVGEYYCKVTYTIDLPNSEKIIESNKANLYMRSVTMQPESDTTVMLSEEGDVAFTCVYSGDSGVTAVEWKYKDQPVPTDLFTLNEGSYVAGDQKRTSTLTVKRDALTAASSGNISCSFKTNLKSEFEPHLTKKVKMIVRDLTISPETETYSADESVTVTCTYQGDNDVSEMSWSINDEISVSEKTEIGTPQIDANQRKDTLVLKNRHYKESSQNVKCHYSFENSDTAEKNVIIKYRGLVAKMNSHYYTTGDNVVLECSVGLGGDGVIPENTLWKKNGQTQNADDKHSITTSTEVENGLFKTKLTIANPNEDDATTYTCTFSFTDQVSLSSDTTVRYRVITTTGDTPYYSHDSAELRLTCTLTSGEGDVQSEVTWELPGGGLTNQSTVTGRESVLVIADPTDDDDGKYSCRYKFSDGEMVIGQYDEVIVALIEAVSPGIKYVTTGNTEADAPTLKLTCKVKSAAVKDNLKWYKGSTPVQGDAEPAFDTSSGYTTSTVSLKISSTAVAGTYQCKISEAAYSKDVNVTVLTTEADFKPETFESAGEVTTLTCKADVVDAVVDPTVLWYHNDNSEGVLSTRADTSGTQYVAKYEITVGSDTVGKYSCKIEYSIDASVILVKSTQVIEQKVTVTPAYSIIKVGDDITWECTVVGPDGLNENNVLWRQKTANDQYNQITDDVNHDAYDPGTNVFTTTLKITPTTGGSITDYECYHMFTSGALKDTPHADVFNEQFDNFMDAGGELGKTATFTCTVYKFTDDPIVSFYKFSDDNNHVEADAAEVVEVTPGGAENAVTYTYTVSNLADDMTGNYFCKVTYEEGTSGAQDATSYQSDNKKLYIREAEIEGQQVVAQGGMINLTCTLSVESSDIVTSVMWYKDGTTTAVKDDTAAAKATFNNGEMVSMLKLQPNKESGGKYKCEFKFTYGSEIVKERQVYVHLLKELMDKYINEETIECEFEGSDSPTFKWFANDDNIEDASDSPFSSQVTTQWNSTNLIGKSTLTIDKSKINATRDIQNLKCKVEVTYNTSETADYETETVLHFREVTAKSNTTYSDGEDKTLTCTFDYGENGVAPATVSWSSGALSRLVQEQEYTITEDDSTTPGQVVSSITLKGVDHVDFADTYTCVFRYSEDEFYSSTVEFNVRVATVDHEEYNHAKDKFEIKCDLISNDDPTTVSFMKGDDALTNNSNNFTITESGDKRHVTLTKMNPTSVDNADYTCKYEFSGGPTVKKIATITVALLDMKKEVLYYGNSGVPLECTVMSPELLTVFWFMDGEALPINQVSTEYGVNVSTTKSSITASSPGEYKCGLSGNFDGATTSSETTRLRYLGVTEHPAAYTFSGDGDVATLQCSSDWLGDDDTSDVNMEVTWQHNGQAVVALTDTNAYPKITSAVSDDGATWDSTLEVEVASGSVGKYQCSFAISGNNAGGSNYLSNVGVIKMEEIEIVGNADILIVAGDSITLSCTLIASHDTQIVWKGPDGNPINEMIAAGEYNEEKHSRTSRLIKENLQVGEAGTFTCETSAVSDSFDVEVYDISVSDTIVPTGTEAKLTCTGSSLPEGVTVKWQDVFGVVIADGITGNAANDYNDNDKTQVSVLTYTKHMDTSFTCRFVFSDDTESPAKVAHHRVFDLKQTPLSLAAKEGEDVTITCDVAEDLAPEYTWYGPGDAAISGQTDSTLVLDSTATTGNYYCTVSVTATDWNNAKFGPYNSRTETMFVRRTVTADEKKVMSGDLILSCVYSGDDNVESVTWKRDDVALSSDDERVKITSEDYDNGQQVFKLEHMALKKNEGGQYTCHLEMEQGEALSATTSVFVYYITGLEPHSYNPTSLSVTYSGTAEATATWSSSNNDITLSDQDSTTFENNERTFSATVDLANIAVGVAPFDVTVTITIEGEDKQSVTKVYKREITALDAPTDSIAEGQFAKLTCTAAGSDNNDITIKWLKGNTEISSLTDVSVVTKNVDSSTSHKSSTLTIKNNDPMYSGNIECRAMWQSPTAMFVSNTVYLDTLGAMMATVSFSNPDGSLAMTCVVWGKDTPTMEWSHEQETITDTDQQVSITPSNEGAIHTSILKYQFFGSGNEGIYTCTAKYSDTLTYTKTTQAVKISVYMEPESPLVKMPGDVAFTCVYKGNSKPTGVVWYKGSEVDESKKIVDGDKYTIETSEYDEDNDMRTSTVKMDAAIEDTSDYMCRWDYDQLELTSVIMLRVVKMSTPESTLVTTTDMFSITCTYEGTVDAMITWYHVRGGQREEVMTTDKVSITTPSFGNNKKQSTLSVREVSPDSNSGEYLCVAEFEVTAGEMETAEAEVNVVIRSAEILNAESYGFVTDGNLLITCIIMADKKPDSITWQKVGGNEIAASDEVSITEHNIPTRYGYKVTSELRFTTFASDDDGTYKCTADFDSADKSPSDTVQIIFSSVTPDSPCVDFDLGNDNTVEVSCNLAASDAATAVTFSGPGLEPSAGTVAALTEGGSEGSFQLSLNSYMDSGTYTCTFTLSNSALAGDTFQVTARETQLLSSSGDVTKLLESTSVQLTCLVEGGANSFSWTKDNIKLADSEYKVIESSAEKEIIEFDVETGSAGTYACSSKYKNRFCTESMTSKSSGLTFTVATATPVTDPTSAKVLAGSNHDLVCEFTNFFYGKFAYIQWFYNDEAVASTGDVYRNQEKIVDGSTQNEKRNSGALYRTTLTLKMVTMTAEGDYKCSIKWLLDNRVITVMSQAATITVRRITEPPVTTNAVAGSEITLTCKANDGAVVELYDVDESVSLSSNSETTTATITVSKMVYFVCTAKWDDDEAKTLRSSEALVFPMTIGPDRDTVLNVIPGHVAVFTCSVRAKLMSTKTEDLRKDGRSVYEKPTVMWSYGANEGENAIDNDDRFQLGQTLTGLENQVSYLYLVNPTTDDENLKVFCKATFTNKPEVNFVGGDLTTNLVVKVAKVEFSLTPDNSALVNQNVELSCSVLSPTSPKFKFLDETGSLNENRFEPQGEIKVSYDQATTKYEATLTIVTRIPTIAFGDDGLPLTCQVTFDNYKRTRTSAGLVTYYDCENIEVSRIGNWDYSTTVKSVDTNGDLKLETKCKPDTATTLYRKWTSSDDGIYDSVTCSKNTGRWSGRLAACQKIDNSVSQYRITVSYFNLDKSGIGYTMCSETEYKGLEASQDKYSKTTIEKILKTKKEGETKCGPFIKIPCLVDGTCTIDTERTSCAYGTCSSSGCDNTKEEDDTWREYSLIITLGIKFDPAVLPQAAKDKTKFTGHIRFWECSTTYDRRRKRGLYMTRGEFESLNSTIPHIYFEDVSYNVTGELVHDRNPDLYPSKPTSCTSLRWFKYIIVGMFATVVCLLILISKIIKRRQEKGDYSHCESQKK